MLVASRTWLQERGYRLIESRGPEAMDQGFDFYAGDLLSIRLTADRSQWFVEVRPGPDEPDAFGWEGWFTLEAWSDCLGVPVLFHDNRPKLTDDDRIEVLANSWWLQPQLDYLRDNLSEIEQASSREHIEEKRKRLSAAQRQLSASPPRKSGD
jgi:hypothetical protein